MTEEHFTLPLPPQGLVFPEGPQEIATIVMGLVVAGFVLYALRDAWKLNTPDASIALKWFAGTLTIVIGLVLMDALSRLICSRETLRAGAAVEGTTPRLGSSIA